MPAMAPKAPLRAKERRIMRLTLTPIRAAARGLKEVARMALPVKL